MGENLQKSISNRCAPAANPAQQRVRPEEQADVWSLTQMGGGMAGKDARKLCCWIERLTDAQGHFQGEIIHPVIGDLQTDSRFAASLREIEIRAAITTDRKSGVIYRKLPYTGAAPNSWITSAEAVMNALVETCGRAKSDHHAGAYTFERLNIGTEFATFMPDVDIMIDKLLANYVIDSLDHPTMQRLLGNSSPSMDTQSDVALEDDDDGEIY